MTFAALTDERRAERWAEGFRYRKMGRGIQMQKDGQRDSDAAVASNRGPDARITLQRPSLRFQSPPIPGISSEVPRISLQHVLRRRHHAQAADHRVRGGGGGVKDSLKSYNRTALLPCLLSWSREMYQNSASTPAAAGVPCQAAKEQREYFS